MKPWLVEALCLVLVSVSATVTVTSGASLVAVPVGTYSPVLGRQEKIKVGRFFLDETAVTNQEFLDFVLLQERWQRNKAPKLFVDQQYLKHWADQLELGVGAPADSPVVNVSWFAAKAYCEYYGKRLPRVSEWEYVGQLGPVDSSSADVKAIILEWYAKLSPEVIPAVRSTFKNKWGIWDIHGLIWEWTEDFNSSFVTGESREDSSLNKSMFCGDGALGAKDATNYSAFMRFGFRSSLKASYAVNNLGFRCAQSRGN